MRPVEIRDLLDYRFLSDVRYAPGGRRAALVVNRCDEASNGYLAELWLCEGGEQRRLCELGGGGGYLWLDDARLLIHEPGGSGTVCRSLDVDSGEPAPLFELPFELRELTLLDANHLAAVGIIDAHDPDAYLGAPSGAGTAPCAATCPDYPRCPDWEVLDELPFWSNGVGFTNKRREALFLLRLDPWSLRRITAPLDDVCGAAVLGGELYYNVRPLACKEHRRGFCVRALSWVTGEERLVAEDDRIGAEQLLAVGEELWLVGSDHRRYGRNENPWFYRVHPAGGFELLRADEDSSDCSVGADCRYGCCAARAAKGGALYTLSTRGGSSRLDRILADGSREAVLDRPGSIDSVAASEFSDELLLVAMYGMRLQELYSFNLRTGALRRLSHFNDEALRDKYVAEPRPLALRSAGCDVSGWVLAPIGYEAGRSYPGVLVIHGGPKTAYGPVFVHEMQVWASRGYFVFYCNPKGSDGAGNAFMDIRGHYGETDYRNVMDFTDAVLAAHPEIDPARVCVTGGSYGGFMTNWIIGHTGRFCCAASQRSISNWISCYGVSDIGPSFVREETAATPYVDPDSMWRQSPLRYAGNVVTPTLFLHSDSDYRCPMEQGIQMYTALMDRGVPARMILFHGEDHELCRGGRPRSRLRRLEEMTAWFERYARGDG